MSRNDKIYSATYSNVPVYEFTVDGNHVMRRRSDDWINATHILKVADYDKPARTRILEREVQKGIHEKVQGGYGKYQGTWIPLADGKELAAKNNVLQKLLPIFDYVPGDRSPPPAPKHATASSKPRAPRAQAQQRRQAGGRSQNVTQVRGMTEPYAGYGRVPDYEQLDTSMQEIGTPENDAISESAFDDYDDSQYGGSYKRRRIDDPLSQADKDHQLWADELLDYFMLQDNPLDSAPAPPIPPINADLNRPIDDKGHTALHWAAAMGDIDVVKDLVRRGASVGSQSRNGETPLMRAVVFTNNHDRQNMEKLAGLLIQTVNMQEFTSGSTVFHHIANTTQRKSKYQCARYYIDCILNKMAELLSLGKIEQILNETDHHRDTAITIAARNGARKCVRSLIGRGAAVDIPNINGETADQLIVQLNHRRQERNIGHRQMSSSPFQGDSSHGRIGGGGAVQSHLNGMNGSMIDPMVSMMSLDGGAVALGAEVYKSESALMLATSILPEFLGKAKSLATSLDAEIADKEAEYLEAERVAATRRAEMETLKRQAEELRIKEQQEIDEHLEDDAERAAELDELIRECEELIEQEQQYGLQNLIEQEEARNHSPTDHMLMDGDDMDSVGKRLELAKQLRSLVQERKALVRILVQNLSTAGTGDKHTQYKQLIVGALEIEEDDIEKALPEIVAELEEYQGMDLVV